MNITQDRIDDLNAVISIQLKKEDYIEKVDKLISDQSKKAKVAGFRSGMVPASYIRKLHGKSILVEQVNTMVSKKLNEYLQSNQIQILGQPLPLLDEQNQPNWDFQDNFEFKYEIGLAPDFQFSISKADKLSKFDVVPDEETLDARIKNLRRAYGKMSTPEVSEPGDVLYSEFQQLGPDGSVYENGILNTASLRTELVKDEEIKKMLIGLKIGDTLIIDLQKAYERNATLIGHLLNIDEQSASQLVSSFKITVKNVNRLEESDLNKEFFLKIYPDGTVTTEAQFREGVINELRSMTDQQAVKRLDADIMGYFVDRFYAELPDKFLKKWLKIANEDRFSAEQIDEQYLDFQKNLKWTLIENKIMRDQSLDIKSQEVVEYAKKKLAEQYKMYSPEPLTEQQLTEYATQLIQDREQATKIYEELRAVKVLGYIKTIIEIGSQVIPFNEFIKLGVAAE